LKATTLEEDLQRHYSLTLGREDTGGSTDFHLYQALALTVRDRLVARWQDTRERCREQGCKTINYLSLEFLMGRTLGNALLNLELEEPVQLALQSWARDLE